MVVRTLKQKKALREGGKKLAQVMNRVVEEVRPGVSAKDLDSLAERLIESYGGKPSFKGYASREGRIYPATLCVSINHEVVHAIPQKGKILKEGDLASLDLGMWYGGYATDMAVTVGVGKISSELVKLLETTQGALEAALKSVKKSQQIGDIGHSIERYITMRGLAVIKDLGGHGVGEAVHEDPIVPNFGHPGQGKALEVGEVLAIEPMASTGSGEIKELSDGWTWVTKDGAPAAHFEHTIMVTRRGAEIFTKA